MRCRTKAFRATAVEGRSPGSPGPRRHSGQAGRLPRAPAGGSRGLSQAGTAAATPGQPVTNRTMSATDAMEGLS